MKSIRFKLWRGMMTLVIVVLILLWFFQIVFLENFYTKKRISDIKREGNTILELIDNGNNKEFEDKLDAFAFHNNMNIEMIDLNGNLKYVTGPSGAEGQMPMMKSSSRVEAYESVLAGKEANFVVTHPRFGNKFIMIGLPVSSLGKISGVLILNMPLAPVEDTASILKWQLFYITIILLIAALFISFFISKSFTMPILEIKNVATIMAKGDFSARIKSKQKDEIGELAKTINYLGQQLSKIEQLRKDFIANVSHELRTPLSLIRGYAETILDVTGNNIEKREKQLKIIIGETERLGKIVEDILNLSQIQSGYFNINKKLFSIKDTVDSVVKRYEVLSEKTGIKIVVLNSSNSILEADEGKLQQVLYNLINNAFNHTSNEGTITVKTIDNYDKVRIQVSDTGKGISKEDIPYIWDRYYKGHKTRGNKIVGTGLGLAIVKAILEAHKANFGVESEKDMGTTFWFEVKKY